MKTRVSFSGPIVKASNNFGYVLAPVLVPDEPDLQGDVITAAEIEKTAHNYVAESQEVWLGHRQKLDRAEVTLVESQIARSDMNINGHFVKSGTWLIGLQIRNPELRLAIKEGRIRGVSIGAYGRGQKLEKGAGRQDGERLLQGAQALCDQLGPQRSAVLANVLDDLARRTAAMNLTLGIRQMDSDLREVRGLAAEMGRNVTVMRQLVGRGALSRR